MNKQDFDITELKALLASEPDNLDLLMDLAKAYELNSLWQEAIETYQQIIALPDGANAEIYNELGTLYEEIDEPDSSEQAYLKALEIQPEYNETLLNLGFLYKEQKRFTEALLVLQKCARQTNLGNEDHAEAIGMIGDILREHEDEIQSSGWTIITNTIGLLTAEMMAARLRSIGIPAWAWQEGAGQAFGLNIGALGTGHVVVMTKDAEEARAILSDLDEVDEDFDVEDTFAASEASPLTKAILGATAVAFNPVGTGLAVLISQFSSKNHLVDCPYCGTALELDTTEVKQGWYVCVECGKTVTI